MADDRIFQVNLRGIISVLSNNLYSGPAVFIRELLQNSTDAIRARSALGNFDEGHIEFSLIEKRGEPSTLVVEDNGIGLTEAEVHRFLATIGESSKRDVLDAARDDFIGQFGIGLLSCFMVTDEIVMITRSARESAPAVEWRGRSDGTYSVRILATEGIPGTQLFLRAKPDAEKWFHRDKIRQLLTHFGEILPCPVWLAINNVNRVRINAELPPWRSTGEPDHAELVAYGRKTFQSDFFDAIPLKSASGEVDGVAYVLTQSPSPSARQRHRLYLKNMLVCEEAQDLLPEWAFFVRCVINANRLRPTASREGFYSDQVLERTRNELGQCLRRWLLHTARCEPERFARFLGIHHLAIKSIAVHDEEFYRLFIDMLPFETSSGTLTLGEYRANHSDIVYAGTIDEFRQLLSVARAQNRCVINAGYAFDKPLLQRLPEIFSDVSVKRIDALTLAESFQDLSLEQRDACFELLRTADRALQPSRCAADVKRFEPASLVALYSISENGQRFRSAQDAREGVSPAWGSLLNNVVGSGNAEPYARLVFNFNSALVQRLSTVSNPSLLRRLVELVYVQALLAGHHPLAAHELKMLNQGLLDLIDLASAASTHSPSSFEDHQP